LFVSLADRLGAKVQRPISNVNASNRLSKTDNTTLFAKLKAIRQSSDFKTSFGNPMEWQREVRQDKELINRE